MRKIAIVLAVLVCSCSYAYAYISSYSTDVDNVNEINTFSIIFDEVPDFYTIDSYGRQKNEFQYYIDADSKIQPPKLNQDLADTIIRGGEIHVGSDIRVRDRFGDGGSESGGWGPIPGSVPYTLDGKKLTFTTPWLLINDSDGVFSYNLLYVEYGGGASDQYNLFWDSVKGAYKTNVNPEPASMLLFGLGGGVMALIKRRRKA